MLRLSFFSLAFFLLSCALCFSCTLASAQVKSTSKAAQPLEPSPLKYNCLVPAGLKPKLEVRQKDGTITLEDAHALYRTNHSEGWYAVFNRYAKTGLTESQGLYPLPRQEIRFTAVAREIGAADAKALLLKMDLALGSSKLVELVAREMASDRMRAMAPTAVPTPQKKTRFQRPSDTYSTER